MAAKFRAMGAALVILGAASVLSDRLPRPECEIVLGEEICADQKTFPLMESE